jgi:hypothetical protein
MIPKFYITRIRNVIITKHANHQLDFSKINSVWFSLIGQKKRLTTKEFQQINSVCNRLKQILFQIHMYEQYQNQINNKTYFLKQLVIETTTLVDTIKHTCEKLNEMKHDVGFHLCLDHENKMLQRPIWIEQLLHLFVKYGGLLPTSPTEMFDYFATCVNRMINYDRELLFDICEYNLGGKSLPHICANLIHYIQHNRMFMDFAFLIVLQQF